MRNQRSLRNPTTANRPFAAMAGLSGVRRLCTVGLFALSTAVLAACDSESTTQIGSNGREIVVTGGSNHSTSSQPDGHVVTVDGLAITITAESVTAGNGEPQPLGDWQRLEVDIDDGAVTIMVDGEALD